MKANADFSFLQDRRWRTQLFLQDQQRLPPEFMNSQDEGFCQEGNNQLLKLKRQVSNLFDFFFLM